LNSSAENYSKDKTSEEYVPRHLDEHHASSPCMGNLTASYGLQSSGNEIAAVTYSVYETGQTTIKDINSAKLTI
jgi:hypothetical protein